MIKRKVLCAVFALLPLGGGLAHAGEGELFRPPTGCTAFLTEQSLDCGVTHFYQCESDPEGTTWTAYFNADGIISVQQTGPDYQWLQSLYPQSGAQEEFLPPAADPISTQSLIDDGIDTYDFSIRETNRDGTHVTRVRGWDELTGDTVKIDGEVLERTRFAIQWLDESGNVTTQGEGTQYFSHTLKQFFLGQETYTDDSGPLNYDDRPVTFTRPGQAGFLSKTPLFNCSSEQARLTAPIHRLQESAHDL